MTDTQYLGEFVFSMLRVKPNCLKKATVIKEQQKNCTDT